MGRDLADLKIKFFADGADLDGIVKLSRHPFVEGFTTNPSLMRKAGVRDYEAFARDVLRAVPRHPVSFEVLAEDAPTMLAQARAIAAWGPNVNVKIPVCDARGQDNSSVIRALASEGVTVNVTAICTLQQVNQVCLALPPEAPAIVSVFAGRIADTGVDPEAFMCCAKELLRDRPNAELLWASTRELYNIVQAHDCGCDIVTVPNDLLAKLDLIGKDLSVYSRETVAMFTRDAAASGLTINTAQRSAA